MQLLAHKLRPDNWGEIEPFLCRTRLKTFKQVERFNVDCFDWRGLQRFNSGNLLNALRIEISGHGFINITAESAFWTNGLWTRAFYVRRSLKGLRKPFERIFELKWNVIWTLLWTFFEMDKSCVPVAELALSGKKYSQCGQSTYCIWFLQW